MEDRRQWERSPASFYAEIRRGDTGQILGHLGDISIRGLLMIGSVPLTVGDRLPLQIELPRDAGPMKYLEVRAQVCWSQPDLNPDLNASGLEFLRGGTADLAVVETLRRLLSSTY
jgi:hypothetical protein